GETGGEPYPRLEHVVLRYLELNALELPPDLGRLVVEGQAGVALELVLGLVQNVPEVLEPLVLAVQAEAQLQVIHVERQRCALTGVARGVEDLEQPHAVEALETKQLLGRDDAEVTPQLQEIRLELLVDLELDARHLLLVVAAVLVARLGD